MQATQRYSKKREAILGLLRSTTEHPGAEWIYLQLKENYPDLSLATVYRNLNQFKEQGLIMSLGTVRGVERFDGNIEPHVHFVCDSCGKVLDLPKLDVPLDLCQSASRETGAKVKSCWLTFRGECSTCKSIPHQ